MKDRKILRAVFVTGNIKTTGRLIQNGWVTTTLRLPTTAKAAEVLSDLGSSTSPNLISNATDGMPCKRLNLQQKGQRKS
jgi:hypothetical protein